MNLVRKAYARADQLAHGQTMAEYALIMAAVAVVVYLGYQLMGSTITTLLTSIDGNL
jgi:Flp pilus assembly pilin Flp